jgi:hypothetical protein
VLLGGEVVVDYSLRLKREVTPETVWVAAYANDVMGYIPSTRVLREGGYEGGGSMVYYGQPSPWADTAPEAATGTATSHRPGIETSIVTAVLRQVASLRTASPAASPSTAAMPR